MGRGLIPFWPSVEVSHISKGVIYSHLHLSQLHIYQAEPWQEIEVGTRKDKSRECNGDLIVPVGFGHTILNIYNLNFKFRFQTGDLIVQVGFGAPPAPPATGGKAERQLSFTVLSAMTSNAVE